MWRTKIFLVLLLIGSTGPAPSREHPPGAARGDGILDSVTTTAWSAVIRAAIGVFSDSLATLGVKPDATPSYDSLYDVPHPPEIGTYLEVFFPHSGGNWPPIWGSRYAFDYTSPLGARWVFDVETNITPGTLTLSWDTSRINKLPPAYVLLMKDSATGVITNMRNHNSYSFQYSAPRLFVVEAEQGATVYNLKGGWNLLSLSRIAADSSVQFLFPTAASRAFGYNGAYSIQTELHKGSGYWIRFHHQETVSVPGLGIASLDIPVSDGWNMIGTVDATIPAPGGGSITSRFFSYDGGYQPVDSLKSGGGYWVKVSGNGTIHLGPGTQNIGKQTSRFQPEPVTLITITNPDNGRQQMMLSPAGRPPGESSKYELPPVPDEGAFDARFTSQRFREEYPAGEPASFTIRIQSPSYPVRVEIGPGDPDICLSVTDCLSGRELGASHGGATLTVTLRDPAHRELVVRTSPLELQPAGTCLLQNYPNPFNPSSTISYSLAEKSEVRLLLADALGREIGLLDQGLREAGAHEVTIDGTVLKLSSGVYFYRLEATGQATGRTFTATNKLMYLR